MLASTKDSLAANFASDSQSHFTTSQEQEREMKVCISLLGEIKVWFEINGTQVNVPIKSYRRQELLAYIATVAPARDQRISSGRIITDVFEHIAPRADVENLRGLFQKHTQLLRKEVNELAQEVNFPRVRLFQYEKVDNSSTKWWLSEECQVVDLPAVKFLYEQMDAAKEEGEAGTEDLKRACHQLIRLYQSYQGDYLEKHLVHGEFGDVDWVMGPFTEYRDMYLQALWDAAVCEHKTGMQPDLSEQERYHVIKRAASFYRTYALHAPKHRRLDLNARKSRRQSERALRTYLRMCQALKDTQAADDCYSLYERLMMEEYPEWKPNASTVEILRAVRQQSGQNPALLNVLDPVEE